MRILTDQGNIDLDDLSQFELSNKTLKFIEMRKGASEIFFSEDIDLRDPGEDFADEIKEISDIALIDTKYSSPARAIALANLLSESFENIEEVNSTQFSVDGAEYAVLLDHEADEEAYEMAKSFFEDLGIEGLSDHAKQYVYDNFVNTKWFDDAMSENNEGYAHDIKDEKADSPEYISRLHEEMVQHDVMPEPEWPEESDFENEDGEIDEDSYEEARSKYEDELTDLVDSSIDDFVESLNDGYDDGLDYFRQNYGDDEIKEIVDKYNLLDEDGIIKYLLDADGRANYLAPYDYNEETESVTFDGKTYDFYIYRLG